MSMCGRLLAVLACIAAFPFIGPAVPCEKGPSKEAKEDAAVVDDAPREARRHRELGDLYSENERFEDACEEYSEAVRLHPTYSRAENNWGFSLFRMGRHEDAVKHYKQALDLDPNYAVAHNNLGVAHYQQGQYRDARLHFEKAMNLEPKYVKARMNLAATLYKQHSYFRAWREVRRARRIDNAYVEERLDPERIRAEVEKDLEANPDDPQLKKILAQLDQLERAQEEQETADQTQ